MNGRCGTLIAVIAALGLLSVSGPALTQAQELARIPDFTLKDVRGRDVSREQFRGKVLLVNFWATWCGPCRKEMPGLQSLYKKYRSRGFAVIGIALDSDSKDVVKLAQELGITYTLLIDPTLMSTTSDQEKWGLMGIPTTLLVDREGIIRKRFVGFEHTQVVENALKEVLRPRVE